MEHGCLLCWVLFTIPFFMLILYVVHDRQFRNCNKQTLEKLVS